MLGNRLEVPFSDALSFLDLSIAAFMQHAAAGLVYGKNGYTKLTLRFRPPQSRHACLTRCDWQGDYAPSEPWKEVREAWETQRGVTLHFPLGEEVEFPGTHNKSWWQSTHGGEHGISWLAEIEGTWEVYWPGVMAALDSVETALPFLPLVPDKSGTDEKFPPLIFSLLEHSERGHEPVTSLDDRRIFVRVDELVAVKRGIERRMTALLSPKRENDEGQLAGNMQASDLSPQAFSDAPNLEAAVSAYLAVKADPSLAEGTSVKGAIKRWVQRNRPSISETARDSIGTVANWDKAGGAPVTPERKKTKPTPR